MKVESLWELGIDLWVTVSPLLHPESFDNAAIPPMSFSSHPSFNHVHFGPVGSRLWGWAPAWVPGKFYREIFGVKPQLILT